MHPTQKLTGSINSAELLRNAVPQGQFPSHSMKQPTISRECKTCGVVLVGSRINEHFLNFPNHILELPKEASDRVIKSLASDLASCIPQDPQGSCLDVSPGSKRRRSLVFHTNTPSSSVFVDLAAARPHLELVFISEDQRSYKLLSGPSRSTWSLPLSPLTSNQSFSGPSLRRGSRPSTRRSTSARSSTEIPAPGFLPPISTMVLSTGLDTLSTNSGISPGTSASLSEFSSRPNSSSVGTPSLIKLPSLDQIFDDFSRRKS